MPANIHHSPVPEIQILKVVRMTAEMSRSSNSNAQSPDLGVKIQKRIREDTGGNQRERCPKIECNWQGRTVQALQKHLLEEHHEHLERNTGTVTENTR